MNVTRQYSGPGKVRSFIDRHALGIVVILLWVLSGAYLLHGGR